MTIINITIFIVLIVFTAFFVATEFAIVKVRHSRIDQLVAEGKKGATSAKHVITHLDEYLSACQLGITVTALGIGMVGESTFEFILHPAFEALGLSTNLIHVFTIGSAFMMATFLHVVVGELAPKTVAIQKAEAVTLLFARPIMIFYKILFPFIWFLNGSARVLVGIFGLKPASEHEVSHTQEEIRLLIAESNKSGEINNSEMNFVNNVFEFDDTLARQIMIPRTEIVGFNVNTKHEEVLKRVSQEKYTRYPVYEGDRDNIIGYFNIKDLLIQRLNNPAIVYDVAHFVNPVINVIEATPIKEVLQKMQKERIQMAILVDEYGGTSGLITIEDIIEELVGEIRDEFDGDEISHIRKINDDHYIIDAKVQLHEVAELLNITLENENVDTLGGWIYTQNVDLEKDMIIAHGGYEFTIKQKRGLVLQFIEVKKQSVSEVIDALVEQR
ncbi:hemolysin family protein [Paenibacillus endoradicis]|uniref:hemolysin family protein n=1 Tax=Paenibacillus endoradicis TaxID=2972487 RepID=UPI00215970DF|nr:hemolysin family protein [Paenibacillus endoradicis]MCR8657634.1 hemolysin family protein [Paenibacillus endoradicis]